VSRLSHSLPIAVLSALALGAGAADAVPAPAAASPTPLVQSVDTLQPGTDLNLAENLLQPQGDRAAIQALVFNAAARERAADAVAGIPATAVQQAAKAEWLSGMRLGVRDDVEMTQAVYALLDGHRSTGMAALHALDSVTDRLDSLIARADGQLGYAPSGTAQAFSPTPVIRKLNLSPAGVRQLIARGLRVQVSTEHVGLTEARLFVYERTLARGGVASARHEPADLRDFISPITRLYFVRAGTQNVTLRVNHDVQAALLRAGSITVGITNYGYISASAG
jgi:hypothetical protein